MSKPVTPWKAADRIFANDKIQAFKGKLKFWKTCIYYHELDIFKVLKDLSIRSVVMLTNVIFLNVLYNKMCQYRDYLYNSVIQYFLKDQWIMLLHHAWAKDPVNEQLRLVNFNVTTKNVHW